MATAELRRLPSRDSRRFALLELGHSFVSVAEATGTTRQSLKRALDAEADGRPLHVSGRPSLLRPEEDEELFLFVSAFRNEHHENPTLAELLTKVLFLSVLKFTSPPHPPLCPSPLPHRHATSFTNAYVRTQHQWRLT